MTARFIHVQGQARFTRKWPFETRVIRQKGVTYCRRRCVPRAIFLSALVAFLPSPSSSYHHGSVLLIHREIRAKVWAYSLSKSRKSRSLMPQTLTRIADARFSRRLNILYLITVRIHFLRSVYFAFFIFFAYSDSKLSTKSMPVIHSLYLYIFIFF